MKFQTLDVDGIIDSNGAAGETRILSGGGAGGSVVIRTDSLQGYGLISATGGASQDYLHSNGVLFGMLNLSMGAALFLIMLMAQYNTMQ